MKKMLSDPPLLEAKRKSRRFRSVPTHRRLEYAHGYILLGMFQEAATELQSITGEDRADPSVQDLLMDLYHNSRQWNRLLATARQHAADWPGNPEGWIMWARALRQAGRVTAARTVLQQGLARLENPSATLHFQLACCNSVLGELVEAQRQLRLAVNLDATIRGKAEQEADLKGLSS